ncbi:hypothetical protein ACFKHW_30855 [Bradyrhizobium lupini]|uniref:hypothetical protein n=1 Tax=Rhizobium lupini TaxID=136996 RepID=UPI0036730D32
MLIEGTKLSFGSHDEWNIARAVNEKRSAKKDGESSYGIARQIAVLFDGAGIFSMRLQKPELKGSAHFPSNSQDGCG